MYCSTRQLSKYVSVVACITLVFLLLNNVRQNFPIRRMLIDTKNPSYIVLGSPKLSNASPCEDDVNDDVTSLLVDRISPSWEQLQWKLLDSVRFRTPVNRNFSHGLQLSYAILSNNLSIWSPLECQPKQSVAIVIPYRAREEQLRSFLNHMHPLFRHQRMEYAIFVVEQVGATHFNRAALFNIGYIESSRVGKFDCYVFHDVDLLPEDARIPYHCRDQPVHLSAALDKFKYRVLYEELFGGAVALSRQHMEASRGFSNAYFGWGGEDDDMFKRLHHKGYKIFRYPLSVARYTMLAHKRDLLNSENPKRFQLLKTAIKRMPRDGYPETEYQLISANALHDGLVYWISVNLLEDNLVKKFNLTTKPPPPPK